MERKYKIAAIISAVISGISWAIYILASSPPWLLGVSEASGITGALVSIFSIFLGATSSGLETTRGELAGGHGKLIDGQERLIRDQESLIKGQERTIKLLEEIREGLRS